MFATLRRVPWGRVVTWSLQTLWNLIRWSVEQLARLIAHSAAGFFGQMVKGSFSAIMIKVAAVLLLLGLVSVQFNQNELAQLFVSLMMFPIMGLAFRMMIGGVFSPAKKKKKKR